MRSIFLGTLALVVILSYTAPAKADYALWADPETGFSLTWPDTWKRVNNADADDLITIMAPSGRAHATCRARAHKDVRFEIYPPQFAPDVQRVAYSEDFWESYLQEYSNHIVHSVFDGAGLGRGYASYALAEYDSAVPGPEMRRRAMLFAANYNGVVYILECSAHKDAYAKWQKLFLSIAGSVDFSKAHTELRSGHYYNFFNDRRIRFKGTEGPQRIVY